MNINMLKYYVILTVFILGLWFMIKNADGGKFEGFNTGKSCPDILVKKDGSFYLHNSSEPIVAGVNPIKFSSLDEYVEFIEWQRRQGLRCPVLYFQQTGDAQGQTSYRMLPDPRNPNIGLSVEDYKLDENTRLLTDASRSGKMFNRGLYPGYDPENQDIGIETPLDKIFTSTSPTSDNPMDVNWGGASFSKEVIKGGKYNENEVKLWIA